MAPVEYTATVRGEGFRSERIKRKTEATQRRKAE